MDTKLTPVQADPRHDSDVVLLAPEDWTDAEEALSRLAHVASDRRRPAAGSDFSAGPRVTEPSRDTTLHPAALKDDPLPADRPSLGRRTSRNLARFLATACMGAAATLAWQSYGGTAEQMIVNSAPQQLGWLLSPPAIEPSSGREIAVEQPSSPAVQASTPQAASAPVGAVAPPASETAASPAPTTPSAELQQLATMAQDLAAVRQSVEQLAAGQEQTARDIAKLQSAGQDIRRRISALPPATTTAARKPVPPPHPAFQSLAAPLATAPPDAAPPPSAAPLPPEPTLRPPMPVR